MGSLWQQRKLYLYHNKPLTIKEDIVGHWEGPWDFLVIYIWLRHIFYKSIIYVIKRSGCNTPPHPPPPPAKKKLEVLKFFQEELSNFLLIDKSYLISEGRYKHTCTKIISKCGKICKSIWRISGQSFFYPLNLP